MKNRLFPDSLKSLDFSMNICQRRFQIDSRRHEVHLDRVWTQESPRRTARPRLHPVRSISVQVWKRQLHPGGRSWFNWSASISTLEGKWSQIRTCSRRFAIALEQPEVLKKQLYAPSLEILNWRVRKVCSFSEVCRSLVFLQSWNLVSPRTQIEE